MRYFITFSYDGKSFAGYQTQPKLRTVQEELEKALYEINNHTKTSITSSGRTDKGVHALGQTAHFDLTVDITLAKLKRAMNSFLPPDIHVIQAEVVPEEFHARYHAKWKEYHYEISLGEYSPLERSSVFQYGHALSIEAMQEAILFYKGKHDFRAFVSENTTKENCVRTIRKVAIKPWKEKNDHYTIIFQGDGFQKYQVRNMVGLLIKVGERKISPSEVRDILASCDRKKAGVTAPSEGLYLVKVAYKESAKKFKIAK